MNRNAVVAAIEEWTRDDAAQIGPTRVLIGNNFDMLVDRIMASQSEADSEPWTRDYKTLYEELIYAVASKYPGETRHQTALKYIRQRENPPNNQAQVSDFNAKRDTGTSTIDAALSRSDGEGEKDA